MKIINHPTIQYATPPILVEMIIGSGDYIFRRDVLRYTPVGDQHIYILALEYLTIKDDEVVHQSFLFQKSFKDEDTAMKAFYDQLVSFRNNLPLWEKRI